MSAMIKYRTLIFMISILSILIYNCEMIKSPSSNNDDEINNNYPTILYPLTPEKLQQFQEEFDVLNSNKICSRLNEYGLTGYDHCFRNNPKIKISDENISLKYAINTLVKNKKFTNVTDSLSLISYGFTVTYVSDDSTHWGIRFGPQKYQGIEVLNTNIVVSLFGDGVFNIDGFGHENVYIPSIDKISKNSAKNKVVGKEIIWYGYGGEPHEFIVSESSVGETINKVIVPLEMEEVIELRVTWKIPINFGSFIGWHIYLDTTTGEEITIIQEFRT